MAMHANPGEQSILDEPSGRSFEGSDQRIFPRIKTTKDIELSMESGVHAGKTYDIGQGGLCFVVPDSIELGPATVRIANSNFVFQGKILASHRSGASKTLYFHFQFDKAVDLATLAVMLGI